MLGERLLKLVPVSIPGSVSLRQPPSARMTLGWLGEARRSNLNLKHRTPAITLVSKIIKYVFFFLIIEAVSDGNCD